MITYHREPQATIPTASVKIIGLGGAGANILERVALDGAEGTELLALNTDVRTLAACVAGEKIQLGRTLTKGLGAGGDPDLGYQAMLEAEAEIRAAVRGRRIVFLCVGLGGGTGSGAAPVITRIAREEGAFVVVFATMPFAFEGRRRRDQAETTLNELAVLSNALVTFDNNRMGELVLAKQGIHEAFSAADRMICESIKAVIRLVIRPGIINVGLDDLMSALRTNRSRCLFGSGLAKGKDRATSALRNALSSPLLDQGALLKDAQTVLVHLCGGEDLTLYEVELLMQRLQKFVPDKAHVLFGAAIDPTMGDGLSVTLISALPEDALAAAPRDSISNGSEKTFLDPSESFATAPAPPARAQAPPAAAASADLLAAVPATPAAAPAPAPAPAVAHAEWTVSSRATPNDPPAKTEIHPAAADIPSLFDEDRPFAEPAGGALASPFTLAPPVAETPANEPPPALADDVMTNPAAADPLPPVAAGEPAPAGEPAAADAGVKMGPFTFKPIKRNTPSTGSSWVKTTIPPRRDSLHKHDPIAPEPAPKPTAESIPQPASPPEHAAPVADPEPPKLKLGVKPQGPQNELAFDATPRGRFEGQTPNVVDGEDLDLPPFLRKKK
jgi:cell division protein FtsZ